MPILHTTLVLAWSSFVKVGDGAVNMWNPCAAVQTCGALQRKNFPHIAVEINP